MLVATDTLIILLIYCNFFAVIVLEISTVLENIYFEEYISVAAQSC